MTKKRAKQNRIRSRHFCRERPDFHSFCIQRIRAVAAPAAPAPPPPAGTAEVERVVVTGSIFPQRRRPAKPGGHYLLRTSRNWHPQRHDPARIHPQEAGATVNLNMATA